MNRTIKVIISIVLCVWIFAMGLELGAYRERKTINSTISNNNPVINQTTAPTISEPIVTTTTSPTSTEAPTIATEPVTSESTTAAQNQDNEQTTPSQTTTAAPAIPSTNEEIAAAFNKAMNNTKHATRDCHATKNTNVELQVTDCSVPRLTSMVNSIAQKFTGPDSAEYDFVGGKAQTSDGEITINQDFPPSDRDVALEASGIATASSEPYGNGGYKLNIKLVPETSTLDSAPKHHASAVGYLDLASLGLDSVTFTEANFNYSGATVSICVNSDDLVEKYECVLPLAGTGSGSIKIASASATLEGSMTENWVFTWK